MEPNLLHPIIASEHAISPRSWRYAFSVHMILYIDYLKPWLCEVELLRIFFISQFCYNSSHNNFINITGGALQHVFYSLWNAQDLSLNYRDTPIIIQDRLWLIFAENEFTVQVCNFKIIFFFSYNRQFLIQYTSISNIWK